MSSSSRADRRRQTRSGSTPPKKRDPMVPIYIGFAVVVFLIFAGFGVVNFFQNRSIQRTVAFEQSTPTPAPTATPKPIPLKNGEAVGKAIGFPKPNVEKNIMSDTQFGGRGQNVDGIPCESNEEATIHIHTQLALFENGTQVQVPPYIGFAPSPTGGCLYWLHTHDPTGVIHVEAGNVTAPQGGPYTLGMFFDVWGQPLNRSQVGPFKGPVTAFVNSMPYTGDLAAIPLRAHQRVTLEVGRPVVTPPVYVLPAGD